MRNQAGNPCSSERRHGLCPFLGRRSFLAEADGAPQHISGHRPDYTDDPAPRQREDLMTPLQRLVRIAQIPEDKGHTTQTHRPTVLTKEFEMSAVPLGIVVDNPLLKVLAGRSKFSEPEAGDAQRIVGLHEENRVLGALGEAEKLRPQLTGGLEFRPHDEIDRQP